MDKSYKKLLGKEKDLVKATKKVVKEDEGRDKKFDKAKKMKGKC